VVVEMVVKGQMQREMVIPVTPIQAAAVAVALEALLQLLLM
jgi:hypothetical protein